MCETEAAQKKMKVFKCLRSLFEGTCRHREFLGKFNYKFLEKFSKYFELNHRKIE